MMNTLTLKKSLLLTAGLLIPALIAAQALAQSAARTEATAEEREVLELRLAQASGGGGRSAVPRAPAGASGSISTARTALRGSTSGDKRVSLDLNQASVRDALKTLLDGSGDSYSVDGDVPEDVRVTVKAQNVRLSTALDLLSEAAGVGWAIEGRDGKRHYHFGKSLAGLRNIHVFGTTGPGIGAMPLPNIAQHLQDLQKLQPPTIYRVWSTEQRSSFTCPHCKGHATVLRAKKQPTCPKCNRVFQPEWQFCPYDSTKRPTAAAEEWKYCPFCGKRVEMEKSMIDESPAAGIPFLREIPNLGQLFTYPDVDVDIEPAPVPAAPRRAPRKAPQPAPPAIPAPTSFG